MKAALYNLKGEKSGEITLPKEVFDVELNTDLVHQVVVAQAHNRRQNSAHTKDRSDVRGGGRKPWRQKGTGRARHGSRRSPIWRGGGVTFGPTNERNFKKKINKKAKTKALLMVLTEKNKKDLVYFTDDFKLQGPKTKEVSGFFEKVCKDKRALVVLPEINKDVILSMRNLENVDTIQAKDINCLDLLSYKYLVVFSSAVDTIKDNFIPAEKDEKQSNKKDK